MSNTCVPGTINNPGPDAGIDAPTLADAPVNVGCPSPYASVAGSAHRYKPLTNVSWDTAAADCKLTSASAYLAVPDDAAELVNLATAAGGLPFWIGIDDKATPGTFVSQQGGAAPFLPWATGQPDQGPPPKQCVEAVSMTEIATEKCGNAHIAVCECEP